MIYRLSIDNFFLEDLFFSHDKAPGEKPGAFDIKIYSIKY